MSIQITITELLVQRVVRVRARIIWVIRVKSVNELLNLIRIPFPPTPLKDTPPITNSTSRPSYPARQCRRPSISPMPYAMSSTQSPSTATSKSLRYLETSRGEVCGIQETIGTSAWTQLLYHLTKRSDALGMFGG